MRPKMVDWYAPIELAKTGFRTLLSTVLGSMLDSRRIAALEAQLADEGVYPEPDKPPYDGFDFMADTGDGWDATYTMAYLLTTPELAVDGVVEKLPRPPVLLLGGDEVYPVASRQGYADRLVSPFDEALPAVRDHLGVRSLSRSDLFLIPGNHDWYDSLGAFSHRFFKSAPDRDRAAVGSFRPQQSRPYFVLRLAHDWEIWALDIQLAGNLDRAQNDFFARRAREIKERGGAKVIIAMAEPDWVYGNLADERRHRSLGQIVALTRGKDSAESKGIKVVAVFAGDVHNYQRYEEPKPQLGGYTRHHVVSGGGGAFLHPTHAFPPQPAGEEPRVGAPKAIYPPPEVSCRLSWRILAFPLRHVGMSLLIGLIAAITFWHGDFKTPLALYPVKHPLSVLVALGLAAALVAFSRAARRPETRVKSEDATSIAANLRDNRRRDRIHLGFGLAHGVGQLCVMVGSWLWAQQLARKIIEFGSWIGDGQALLERGLVVVIAGLLGGFLFGVYLFLALNLGRFHHNEAFSAIAWPHHKNFLRCRVIDAKTVEVFALGVEKTRPQDEVGEEPRHPVPVRLIERFKIEV